MKRILNYINGSYVAPKSNEWIDNYNPSNGEVYGQIPNSGTEDVEAAYQAAKAAFPSWSNTTLEERSNTLHKIAVLIEESLSGLAHAESLDNGKPLSLASRIDIPRELQVILNFLHKPLLSFPVRPTKVLGLMQ